MKPVHTIPPPATLWTDSSNAITQINTLLLEKKISKQEAEQLKNFHLYGFIIIPAAITVHAIDDLLAELKTIHLKKEEYLLRLEKNAIVHPAAALLPKKSRLLDIYVRSTLARNMVLSKEITRYLNLLYGEPALAFQSLLFTWGSQQSMHKDTAFVKVNPFSSLTASWIALEDIDPGQGELLYYPGSHKDSLFLFSEQYPCWNAKRDGKPAHNQYTRFILHQAETKGVEATPFYARKGDVLIWHPNLAHGGAAITQAEKTRFSLVTHYCPMSANPAYFSFFAKAYKRPWLDGFYSSRRYDLQEGSSNPFPVFKG